MKPEVDKFQGPICNTALTEAISRKKKQQLMLFVKTARFPKKSTQWITTKVIMSCM